jgi:hypothetical protein
MQELRRDFHTKEMGEWKIRFDVLEEAVLFKKMLCGSSTKKRSSIGKRRKKEGSKNKKRRLLNMRAAKSTGSSRRRKCEKQLSRKFSFSLSVMPHKATFKRRELGPTYCFGEKEMPCVWRIIPAEKGKDGSLRRGFVLERVWSDKRDKEMVPGLRINRIRALGNAQIPAVARLAWERLG